jgi:hypothetical protein
MFGRSKAKYDPQQGVVMPKASVGDIVLDRLAANVLGISPIAMKRQKALRDLQGGFLNELSQDLAGTPDTVGAAQIGNDQGADISAAFAPQMEVKPGRAPLSINSPEMARRVLEAQRLGVPISGVVDVLKAQQPDVRFDRGFGYNGKTGAALGGYHPDLDKGIQPTTDGGAAAVPGYADAAASIEAAKTGAQERAKAPYSFQTITGPTGKPIVISNETAAALGARGAIIGQGPSPAQSEADKAIALAGAQANIDTPRILGNAAQAMSLIEQMKGHAGLDSRTGWRSALPALPGTPGADFQAMADQLKGKVFLEAFGSLKGAGQITEVEGRKATDAIGRLSQQQTKEGYLKALNDLEEVINAGAARAAGQAQRLQPAASGFAARPSGSLSSVPVADRMAEARRRGLIP